jgi:hypothetical protein
MGIVMTSLATEPTEKCEYHYIWRHYFVEAADDEEVF